VRRVPTRRASKPRPLLIRIPAARIPANQRAIKLSITVDKLCLIAYEDGIPNASLEKLVDIITLPNQLDHASLTKLIKNFYPATRVQDTVVVKVVGSLGHGRSKPPFPAQVAMLKWLVMVYDVLEHPVILSQLYAILFNLLDTIAIRYVPC
jgi:centromere protein I